MHYQSRVIFYFELVFLWRYEFLMQCNVDIEGATQKLSCFSKAEPSEKNSTCSAILNKLRPAEVCCKNHEAMSPIRLLSVTSVLRRGVKRRGNVSS